MARHKLYGQFHQPSHILRYYHIEMECFVYNWRILLGGAASAAILTVGVAAPAFAQSQAGTSASSSEVTQDGNGSGPGWVPCGLPLYYYFVAIPLGAQPLVDWCGMHPATGDDESQATGPMQAAGPASDLSSVTSALPGLNSVSGSVPGTLSGLGG